MSWKRIMKKIIHNVEEMTWDYPGMLFDNKLDTEYIIDPEVRDNLQMRRIITDGPSCSSSSMTSSSSSSSSVSHTTKEQEFLSKEEMEI